MPSLVISREGDTAFFSPLKSDKSGVTSWIADKQTH